MRGPAPGIRPEPPHRRRHPDRALAGFTRVALEPGQSAEVAIPIDRRSLQYWDVDANRWVTPTGAVPLYVGSSLEDIRVTGELSVPADTVAPTVTITPDPAQPDGDRGWYVSPVTLAFAATDDQDAAPVVEVSVNGGEFSVQDGPLVLEADGVYTVTARARDAAGNVSEPVTVEIRLDRTPPTVTAERTRLRLLIAISASDQVSGVASIQYRYRLTVGERDITTPWRRYVSPVLALPNARLVLEYRATDNAGNVSAVSTFP